jgi:chromosomal replication initiator protein
VEVESTSCYTFDSFVVGSCNRSAYDAAQQIVQRSGKIGKPVVFCGGTGTGKTHLMQAISHEMKRRSPDRPIIYSNPEKFTNGMISSIKQDKMAGFCDFFCGLDVLLIDDIQISGRERTNSASVCAGDWRAASPR